MPKELIPVGNLPVLHYVVEEAVQAGCDNVVIVLSAGKEAICRYFERDPGLEQTLMSCGRQDLMVRLRNLQQRVKLHYVYQEQMRGLGDAVLCGTQVTKDQPFAVLLGDTIIAGESPLQRMVAHYGATGRSSVAVQEVSVERATRYGVCAGKELDQGHFCLSALVEKPGLAEVPQVQRRDGRKVALAFAARYYFSSDLVAYLRQTEAGRNGEIQLTDAMQAQLSAHGFDAFLLSGQRMDIGTPQSMREAMELVDLL